MNPITHLLAGWGVANAARLDRRDRALVTVAGIAPDLDGFGIVMDVLTSATEHPTEWWGSYHHVVGHNVAAGAVVVAVTVGLAHRRVLTAALAMASFHLHLLCDVIGSRGPDGYQWPISYLAPFSEAWQWIWSGQWALNDWPNFTVTGGLLAITFYLAWRRGYSPLELISSRADRTFVAALRLRFGRPQPSPSGAV